MTWPEQPRHRADPEPRTTPLPIAGVRTTPRGPQVADPATSKISLPHQRAGTPGRRATSVPEQRAAAPDRPRTPARDQPAPGQPAADRPAPGQPAPGTGQPAAGRAAEAAPGRTDEAVPDPADEAAPGEVGTEQATTAVPKQPGKAAPEQPRTTAPAETQADRHRRAKAAAATRPRGAVLLTSVLIGAIVSIGLGVYGRMHVPTGYAVNLAGFSSPLYVKAWLASVTGAFAVLQLVSAVVITRRARRAPAWVSWLHRWSGRIAVLVSIPVAMQCLFSLGFQVTTTRVLLHSLAGCVFYGAFTTKMLSLTRRGTPRWAVPLFGGLVFTIVVALWLSSALWLFRTQGVHL